MHSSSSGVFSNCRVATSVLFKPGFQSQMAVLLGSHYMSEIFPFLPPICQFYLLFSHSVISDALLQSSWLLCPWDFPGKNTRVGCHFLLQGIFPTQGLNQDRLCQQVDSLPLGHLGSPLAILCMAEFAPHHVFSQDFQVIPGQEPKAESSHSPVDLNEYW